MSEICIFIDTAHGSYFGFVLFMDPPVLAEIKILSISEHIFIWRIRQKP